MYYALEIVGNKIVSYTIVPNPSQAVEYNNSKVAKIMWERGLISDSFYRNFKVRGLVSDCGKENGEFYYDFKCGEGRVDRDGKTHFYRVLHDKNDD